MAKYKNNKNNSKGERTFDEYKARKSKNHSFRKNSNSRDNRSFRRDENKSSRRDRPNMTTVTCSSCGIECKVPFKPTSNKPVYCNDCYNNNNNNRSNNRNNDRNNNRYHNKNKDNRNSYNKNKDNSISKKELTIINEKLDKIMKALKIF